MCAYRYQVFSSVEYFSSSACCFGLTAPKFTVLPTLFELCLHLHHIHPKKCKGLML